MIDRVPQDENLAMVVARRRAMLQRRASVMLVVPISRVSATRGWRFPVMAVAVTSPMRLSTNRCSADIAHWLSRWEVRASGSLDGGRRARSERWWLPVCDGCPYIELIAERVVRADTDTVVDPRLEFAGPERPGGRCQAVIVEVDGRLPGCGSGILTTRPVYSCSSGCTVAVAKCQSGAAGAA
jgi:hypothetical protein